MNGLMNMISSLLGQNFNQENPSEQNSQTKSFNVQNSSSDYPDVFFTNNSPVNTMQTKSNTYSAPNNSNGGMLGSLLNPNMLKNFLPLLTKKGGGANLSGILQNINPNLSNIMGIFKNNKTSEKKEETLSREVVDLDLSEYTEVS